MSPPLPCQGTDPERQPLPTTVPTVGTPAGWSTLHSVERQFLFTSCMTLGKSHQLPFPRLGWDSSK